MSGVKFSSGGRCVEPFLHGQPDWKSRMRRYTAGVTMRHVGSEEEQQPSV